MCEYLYDNGPTIYDSRLVVARRDHKCCECRQPIKKGEVYERVKGLWDGSWSNFKTCLSCYDVWQRIHHEEIDTCDYGHGSLRQLIVDCDFVEEDESARGSHCGLVCTVSWLRRGVNGRFELVEVKEGESDVSAA